MSHPLRSASIFPGIKRNCMVWVLARRLPHYRSMETPWRRLMTSSTSAVIVLQNRRLTAHWHGVLGNAIITKYSIWKDKRLSLRTKTRLYQTLVLSVLPFFYMPLRHGHYFPLTFGPWRRFICVVKDRCLAYGGGIVSVTHKSPSPLSSRR